MIINELIKLMRDINIKELPETENLKKVANIVEKILTFHDKQKGRGFEILTPKQMLQMPHLEVTQVLLVHSNIGNNDYQQESRVLHTFVSNK